MDSLLVAMSKRRVNVRIVRVKLELDDAIIKGWFISNIQDINHLRYFVQQSPMIEKTFDAMSFFLWMLEYFLSLSSLWGEKIMFSVYFACSLRKKLISRYRCRISLSLLYILRFIYLCFNKYTNNILLQLSIRFQCFYLRKLSNQCCMYCG